MDSLIDATIETLLCREVYAARVRAAMPHGQMQHVARRAGISRQFLHRILVVDDGEGPCAEQAWPSVETATRVAGALAVEEKEAAETLRWMLQALSARRQGGSGIPLRRLQGKSVEVAVDQINELAKVAKESPCPVEGQAACRSVVDRGAALLEKVDSGNHARVVVEVSLSVHEALCRLGEHARALYYARRAEYVLKLADGACWRRDQRGPTALRVAVSQAVGAAYAALGFVKQAMKALTIARQWAREGSLLKGWLARINGTEIQTWTGLRRFAVKRIRELLEEALAGVQDATGSEMKELRRHAAEGYLTHACKQRAPMGVLAAGRELEELRRAGREGDGWTEGLAMAALEDRWVQMAGTKPEALPEPSKYPDTEMPLDKQWPNRVACW